MEMDNGVTETSTLLSWRWCDFSDHPRAVMCADWTDQRPSLSHTESYQTQPLTVRVEKVVLSNDLRDVHAFFQHLVITQVVGRKAASPEAHLLDLLSPGDRLGHLPV